MSRKFVIILGLFLLASAGIGCQGAATPTPAPITASNALDTSSVVTADGIIQPVQSADLNFTVAGTVAAINVNVGDSVKKGDLLAKLDDAVVREQIAQAEAAVALAQAQLTQLQTGATPAERAAAQAALDAAQKNYDRLRAGPTASDLAAAQAAVTAAQQDFDKVRAGPTADQLGQLKAQIDNAKAALDQAQSAYDKIGGATNPYIELSPQSLALQQATNAYDAALAAYNDARTHPTTSELAAARSQVQQAQAALDRLTPDAAELAAAESQVQQAQAVVAKLDPAKDALDVGQAQLQSAQAALKVAQANDADYSLTAPFDGVIGAKNISVGDTVVPGNPTPTFTLGDISKLRLETTNLAEADAPKIKVGQSAQVTLDAFPGKTFQGKVYQISPSATENRGDKVFTVWIVLDDGVSSGLRWGMSATAKIAIQ